MAKTPLLRTSALALALVASTSIASAQEAAPSASPRSASAGVTSPMPPTIVEPVRDFALTLAPAPVSDGRWRGGILFDEAFRSAIRLSAVEDQEIARHVSDVLLLTVPLVALVDGLATPLAQGNGELAWRATFAHVLALGVTLGAGEIVKRAAGRARPFERDCAEDPTRRGCGDSDIFSSFYSLHSGVTFTSAGFMCAMHGVRGMYGNTAADATACGVSIAMAATTGLLRVVSDRHYISDVLVGAALGFLVGFFLPLAIVPEIDHAQPTPVTPQALEGPPPVMIGPTFSGTF
ncbi:phosphatase PAP2 family protein [Sandaracinus amylolyticus]|uniref:phosphatase PAP2 family protein n=1 Tax=Sandaracinus amylolyticus TaxID=927083 RepID=UPI001F1D6BF5|nr:phosphatase PAP2 family protein [Sandaracinus amylolyticus]UJR86951.1 Hypothetical protein I5071_90520 [Sandaracinus amylolyticus]